MLRQAEIWADELAEQAVASARLRLVEASNFVTGARADFARLVGKRGSVGAPIRRDGGENHDQFRGRVQALGVAAGARFAVVGGIDPGFDPAAQEAPPEPPPRNAIALPDGPLHPDQRHALRLVLDERRSILRAGRRWGKSTLCCAIAADEALLGHYAAYIAPQYKLAAPVFEALTWILRPILASKDRNQGLIKTDTGGELDVWTVESGTVIGRGRRYHRIILDEIAHVLDSANMAMIWASALAPTLLDFRGSAVAASTPAGISPGNWFFTVSNAADSGWLEHHAPSSANPFLDRSELKDIQARSNPMVFRQEYLAEFVSLDGAALFNLASLLQPDGEPWPVPQAFDYFFVCIDSAMKTGSANDGNGVVYVGLTERYNLEERLPIMWILDWDLMQVGAGKIEPWFEMIWARCQELTSESERRRVVEIGAAYVEDAAAGSILIQNFQGIVEPLPTAWLSRGKDLRAYAVEPYMNSGRVRITEPAYHKTVLFKELAMNHLWAQLNSFVMGDREAHKRSDDLLDAVVYAASVVSLEWPAE
jgi:hypothetical protein